MAELLLGISGRVEVGETLTAVTASDGALPQVQWQVFSNGAWVNVGTAGAPSYVIPSNAAGLSFRLVATSAGQTFYSAATASATADTNKAGAPTLAGSTPGVTVQEGALAATLFNALTFTDPDKGAYGGGSLLVLNTQNSSTNLDTLSIRFAGTAAGQFSYNAVTRDVLYAFTAGSATVIGTIDSVQNGSGTGLKVVFNTSATKAVVDALIDNVTFANNDDSPLLTRFLTLRVTDPTGGSAQRVLAVNVNPQADAPVFTSGASFTIDENQGAVATVTATDPDQEANAQQGMAYSLVAGAADNARFAIDAATGALQFQSLPDFEDPSHSSQYTVRVRATDVGGSTTDQTITVSLGDVNEAPVAQALAATAQEDGPAVTLQAAFADPDAQDSHTVTMDTTGTVGQVTQDGQTFTYDAAGRFEYLGLGATATDTFTYTVTDAAGLSSTQTATITVVGSNDTAVIGGAATADLQDEPGYNTGDRTVGGTLTVADADQGQALLVAQSSDPADANWGQFVVTAPGAWTYTVKSELVQMLGEGETRVETFVASSVDGSATRELSVTLHGSNDVPLILPAGGGTVTEDGFSTAQNRVYAIDWDSYDTVTWSGSAAGTYGAFAIDGATGNWSYALDNGKTATNALAEGQTATDVFTVTATDNHGGSSSQQVSITVQGANDLPVISGASELTGVVQEPEAASGKLDLGVADANVMIDAVGRIVIAGPVADPNVLGAVITRYNLDGSVDESYGLGGHATPAGLEYGLYYSTLDPSGRAVVGDSSSIGRFDENGNLDTSFGTDGYLQFPAGLYGGRVLMIDSDGKMLLDAQAGDGPQWFTREFVRLNPDGSFDESFGDGGRLPFGPEHEGFEIVAVDPQGGLRALGTLWDEESSQGLPCISRYHPDMTLDAAFGDGGRLLIDDMDFGSQLIVCDDGSMLIAGTENFDYNGGFTLTIARLTADGVVDSTFGDAGRIVVEPMQAYDLTIDAQGRPVLAFNTIDSDANLVRYNVDGSIDPTFGLGGMSTIDLGGWEFIDSIDTRPDGSVLLTAASTIPNYHLVMAGFDADGNLDHGFGDPETGEVLVTGNLFTSGDPDAGDTLQWSGSALGTYGEFILTPQGSWTYVLDTSSPVTQALDEGELVYETFTATLSDSYGATATRDIVITVVGSYDPPPP
jgi:uncharacterized delta-60 repeat protein